ncbi:hypothetical protein Tco_1366663, partial [Tanacetum coccineum]
FVMSDSKDSTVTYTEVSSPFEDLSDIGSLGVDGLPMMLEDPYVEAALQASPSPDYVHAPKEPEQAPPSPVFVPYVPEPVYPEFMPPEDELLPADEQPLPVVISPTADSPGYITKSNPEEDPKKDDEDPEEDPVDYPTDRDDDEEEEESSRDDDDDEEEDKDEDKEEEEHPAPADSIPPPPPAYRVMARMSIRPQAPVPFLSEEVAEIFLSIPTLPPSPLTLLSSLLPQIPSLPLLVSPPIPTSPTYPLGYRAALIQLRAKAPSTSYSLLLPPPIILSYTRSDAPPLGTPPSGTPSLLPIPAPTSSPPLLLPSTDHRADRLEVCLPPRKRLCIALGPRYEIGESSSAPAARPTRDTWDEVIEGDTDEIDGRLDEAQDARSLMSGQLNLLRRDRRAHAYTALLMEREARLSREAWR